MFNLAIAKEVLLPRLLTVVGAIDKKQSVAILANFLLKIDQGYLIVTATDGEIDIAARLKCEANSAEKEITVPAKKFIDIIRSLDDQITPTIEYLSNAVLIKAGSSQFKLATLPAEQFPVGSYDNPDIEFQVNKTQFVHLLQMTCFAIAQQDVRIFLNGLLLEIEKEFLTTVATDGHRMAICKLAYKADLASHRFLLPRKGVLEMLRLLNGVEDEVIHLSAGKNYFKLVSNDYTFITKLIEARFPLYQRAIPLNSDKFILIDKEPLKRALTRIIILAHEKSRAVLLQVQSNGLTLVANNQDQEEATEVLNARVEGTELKIGINASYLLDVLNYLPEGLVKLSLTTADHSILVESLALEHYQYIIMPMKL